MRISVLFILFVLCSCQQEKSLREFYYPVGNLQDGLVYEYHSVNEEKMPPYYWYYKSFTENGAQQFSGQYYNELGVVQQFTLEQITDQGSTARVYRLFEYDSLGTMQQATVDIENNQVFPFQQTGEIQRFKINWTDPLTKTENSLNRGRIFQQWTDYSWNGKSTHCAEFLMVETIEVEEVGAGVQTIETTTKELFAEGIGLIYYQKKIGDKLTITYELRDRIPMTEFEKRFAQ